MNDPCRQEAAIRALEVEKMHLIGLVQEIREEQKEQRIMLTEIQQTLAKHKGAGAAVLLILTGIGAVITWLVTWKSGS